MDRGRDGEQVKQRERGEEKEREGGREGKTVVCEGEGWRDGS